MEDLQTFLKKCRYVPDQEQFGRPDFWMPADEFERSRKGDCEDFALYAGRQLLTLGYSARFVAGRHGRFGEGHAWVTFEKEGKTFLLEPQTRSFGLRMPRLSTLAYEPYISVAWDGERAHFYRHERHKFTPPGAQIPVLVLEWAYFYTSVILKLACFIPFWLGKLAYRRFFRRKQI